ncbi:MAG: L,D-transpeptidase family protein, partial [Acidimicrobiales bacterium]
MRPQGLSRLAGALALAITLAACSSADSSGGSARSQGASVDTLGTLPSLAPETSTSSSSSSSSTTSTTEATTSTTAAAAQPSVSATIPSVRALQERLAELGYDVGTPDGKWGARTTYSLMAFQKVEGLTADGQDGPRTQAALAGASTPGPMVPGGSPTRIEIDVARQVLFHWVGGSLARILTVSTGNNERYCVDGACSVAVTPGGTFRIGRKAVGLEVAPLGELWWPMYFNGGIAIHGSASVPAYPASHGCIRIPMYAAPTFFDQVPAGTRVHVLNSPEAEAPPDEGKAVPNAIPPPDTTTTTEAPAPAEAPTTKGDEAP